MELILSSFVMFVHFVKMCQYFCSHIVELWFLFCNYIAEYKDYHGFTIIGLCFLFPSENQEIVMTWGGVFNLKVGALIPYFLYSLWVIVPILWTYSFITGVPKSRKKHSPTAITSHLINAFILHFQSSIWYQRDSNRKVQRNDLLRYFK
jgi:hypothetical protein